MSAAESKLRQFLASRPVADGIYEISPARGFQHEEGDYDRQYGNDLVPTEDLRREAKNFLDICRRHDFPAGGTVVEIGSGTGRISVGLALQPEVGHLFITDPSPAFCGIVQRKLAGVAVEAREVDLGLLRAEDVGLLPAESVSMILLRSVLHHINDVDGFLRACARVLRAGGMLVCEEPYYEGYMMMGFLAQFIETALAETGYVCTNEDRERVNYFVATMQYYCRRDLDKSNDEDKHLFRPDELMVSGRGMGLELTHYPNRRITDSESVYLGTIPQYFERFFGEYLRYCVGWPREFAEQVITATAKYFRFFEPLEAVGNTTPHCFGTFVFVKR